ncbi:MAG: voltage-gated sodium channel [Solirubrobacterales bacterium]|nr:voltage-gated sodium channel [Solirubrobacterales bacterium]
MARICKRIADSGRFQGFILVVIVLNAITLGVQTYDLSENLESTLTTLDDIFLGIFVVELIIRIAAFGSRPQDFFQDGWNVFDFIVIAAAFVPGIRENATLLRIVRLLRVVRVVTVLPDLRILLRALVRSIPPILSLAVLTLMLMYVYGMVGWILFHEQDPKNWGDLGTAMLSTFTMLTLENWPKLLEQGMAIHPNSWIFFVSYVLLASFLVINILIAIIINSVEQVHQVEREEERADRRERLEEGDSDPVTVADRLTGLRDALDELELDLQSGAALEATGPTTKRPSKGGRMRA